MDLKHNYWWGVTYLGDIKQINCKNSGVNGAVVAQTELGTSIIAGKHWGWFVNSSIIYKLFVFI